jgi:hypothetical protein
MLFLSPLRFSSFYSHFLSHSVFVSSFYSISFFIYGFILALFIYFLRVFILIFLSFSVFSFFLLPSLCLQSFVFPRFVLILFIFVSPRCSERPVQCNNRWVRSSCCFCYHLMPCISAWRRSSRPWTILRLGGSFSRSPVSFLFH